MLRLVVFLFFVYLPLAAADEGQESLNNEAIKAIINNDVATVRELLDRGLDPNYLLGEAANIMRISVGARNTEILLLLLNHGGNPDHKLVEGPYFVNYVASIGNDEALKAVIDARVSLDGLMYFDQYTAFIGLLRWLDVDMLRYILENGNLNINYIPPNGYSALYRNYVINDCGIACLEIMLTHCADAWAPIKYGEMDFYNYLVGAGDSEALALVELVGC